MSSLTNYEQSECGHVTTTRLTTRSRPVTPRGLPHIPLQPDASPFSLPASPLGRTCSRPVYKWNRPVFALCARLLALGVVSAPRLCVAVRLCDLFTLVAEGGSVGRTRRSRCVLLFMDIWVVSSLGLAYRESVCVPAPPQIPRWKSTPQGDGMRTWGHWQVTGHQGGAP